MPELALPAVVALAAFIAGVILSTKVKDWLQGVPGSLRTELNALELHVKAQVKGAQSAVVADIKSKVVLATPVLATSAGPAPAPVTAAVIPASV